MSTLPTREEIAEILKQALGWHVPTTSIDTATDAILARLRPAWERSITQCASCERTLENEAGIILSRVNVKGIRGVFVCQWCRIPDERDALRADLQQAKDQKQALWISTDKQIRELIDKVDTTREDLRACAEALADIKMLFETETAWKGTTINGVNLFDKIRAALARPGVQAEMKK